MSAVSVGDVRRVLDEAYPPHLAEKWDLSLIHISEPTRPRFGSRMPSSA